MPYIKEESRGKYNQVLACLRNEDLLKDVGELNFLLTNICKEYLRKHGEKYQHYNDIVGALECCKLEYYRRRIAKYEDKKIKDNGDVE